MTRMELGWAPSLNPSIPSTRILPGLGLSLCGTVILLQRVFAQADSIEVYKGIQQIIAWLALGRSQPLGPIARFPVFQYLTGFPLMSGVWRSTPSNIFVFWSWCSRVSFAGLAALLYHVGRQSASRALPWLVVVLVLCSPLTAYGASTFNELPAALLIAGFTAHITGGGGVIVGGLLFILAGLTKEVTGPLLAIIWLGNLWIHWPRLSRSGRWKHAIALTISFLLMHSIHAAFNWFRYGMIWNAEYLRDGMLVHSFMWRIHHLVSLWLSPNGGLLLFWPLLGVLMSGMLSCVKADRYKTAVIVFTLLLVLTIGLADWTSPFGWWSWGPRLMLCWMPAVIILIVRGYGEELDQLAVAWLGSGRAFMLTCAIVAIIAVPHVLALERPEIVLDFFGGDDDLFQVDYPNTPEPHHRMIMYQAWQKRPILITAMRDLAQPMHALGAVSFSAGLVLLLSQARMSALAAEKETDG